MKSPHFWLWTLRFAWTQKSRIEVIKRIQLDALNHQLRIDHGWMMDDKAYRAGLYEGEQKERLRIATQTSMEGIKKADN